ncbi:hypothetical protein ACFL23_01135 [Patescibacteria group bacterium]
MKKLFVTTVALLLFVAPIVVARPALAANELVFDADTTIDLSSPDTDLTILNNSQVDSMTTNAGSIAFTMSTDGKLTLRSASRKTMSHNSTSLPINYTCGASYSEIEIPALVGVSASTFTITVTSDTCTTVGGTTGGGGGGGGGVSTTVETQPATTETTTTTATTEATATTETTTAESATTEFAQKIVVIATEATQVMSATAETIALNVGASRDVSVEQTTVSTYVTPLISDLSNVSNQSQTMITNFIAYGTQTTKVLGAGERAGVVNSFKKAYSKLPTSEVDWQDAIKIANGRFPAQQSITKEQEALKTFIKIYKRLPDFSNTHDEAALKVVTYGIRPTTRNLDSEKFAIKVFKSVYGNNPSNTTDWDIMRAISYSGATR